MNTDHFVIILENPKYAGNIGMIARLVANFSLPPLRILGTKNPFSPEMEWMAANAEKELDRIRYFEDINECISDLDLLIGTGMISGKDRGEYLDLKQGFRDKISQAGGMTGLVFGREDRGLSRKLIDRCNFMVDFDLPGYQKSMNLAHSVTYVLSVLYNFPTSPEKESRTSVKMNEFFQLAKKIFILLGMGHFHGNEHLAVKRLRKILENGVACDGDRDFLFKLFRTLEERL